MRRVAAVVLSALVLTSVQAEPIRIDSGLVEGVTLGSGVRAWLGVPQAAPPLRELRWRAPQPVPHWDGVFHADRPAPMCLQVLRTRTMNHYFGNEATSEDCLYLNVWAPPFGDFQGSPARAEKLPVIVWIYGGGFTVGSAKHGQLFRRGSCRDGVVRVNSGLPARRAGFPGTSGAHAGVRQATAAPATPGSWISSPACNGCSGTSPRSAVTRPTSRSSASPPARRQWRCCKRARPRAACSRRSSA